MAKNSELSKDERIAIVKDYIQSGLSQRKYHELNEPPIGLRTLERWCVKYKKYAIEESPEYTGASRHIVYRDDDGSYMGSEWVKYSKKTEDIKETLKAFADGLKDDIPRAQAIPPPETCVDKLLTTYILTDLHVGMRSDTWNIEIAEANIKNYFDEALAIAPASSVGVICFQGDTAHFDSLEPVTPANKHVLDADCNARTMTRAIIRMIRYGVEQALKKHNHVHLVYIEGNHDQYGAVIHSEWLNDFYEYEPRVTVDTNNSIYHVVEWGNTSLFFHHGHKRNLSDISKTFAAKFREVFGRTKYSYGHIGHYHHVKRKPFGDDGLMDLRIHPTLSGKDDYANRGGWESERGANVITYCREKGYRGEFRVDAL